MNKQEFLQKLKKSLQWRFSEDEVTDVLSDYEGFFASGEAEGKGEADICAELGAPKEIVKGLAEGRKSSLTKTLWVKIAARTVLTALFMFFVLVVTTSRWFAPFGNTVSSSMAFYLITVPFLWVIIAGFKIKPPPPADSAGKVWTFVLLAFHAAVFIAIITDYTLQYRIMADVTYMMEEYDIFPRLPDLYLDLLRLAWAALTGIILLSSLFSVYGFYRKTPQWFTVAVHALGAAVCRNTIMNNLNTMDPTNEVSLTLYYQFLRQTLSVYIAAVGVAVSFAVMIRAAAKARRRK